MRFWRKPKSITSLLGGSLSEEMLDESLLLDHVKTEDYLTVALEIRPCSFLTIPAELRNGDKLGKEIDELCAGDLQAVLSAAADEKGAFIHRLKERIGESFRRVVFVSATYKAHIEWARRLYLGMRDVEVRPSIHELYLFKDARVKKELRSLMRIRKAARERVQLSIDAPKTKTCFAFPEELSPEYLSSVGKLLGYPSCCVERYVRDRLSGEASAEMRAGGQIDQLRREGNKPDTYAYFARNFFPCDPKCRNASEIGRRTFDLLSGLNPKIGNRYFTCMMRNVEMVENYPELTRQHVEKLTKKAQKVTRVETGNQNNFKPYTSITDVR